MKIYFDGYCPESLLNGIQVEMRLNEDDFWESEKTGLQMTVFPPFAAILNWRGTGKFKQSSEVASNTLVGLIITEAKNEDGKEIFPDEKNIINNKFDLEWYLDGVYASKEKFDAAKFNPKDPVFEEQEHYLKTIQKEDFQNLVDLFDTLNDQNDKENLMSKENFTEFHKILYKMKLIFNFNWMTWHKGWKNINDNDFDFSNSSLLDLSMYLTAIFRADRFNDVTIEQSFKNGTLDKIFKAVLNRISLN